MDITNDVHNSLMHYFKTLESTGYMPYENVYKLLIYILIEEMLTGEMSYFITEDDYKDISKALSCLYGPCMIPYPSYLKGIEEVRRHQPHSYRHTEDSIIRNTEDSHLRLES